MDEIRAEQEAILDELRQIEDDFTRDSYLLSLAALLPPCPEDVRQPENEVKGCQSHVWLKAREEQGLFRFSADSDTYIIKGLLYLLMNVLDGRPLRAAAEAELYFWKDPMLMGSFDDRRQRGIGYAAASLQKSAARLLKENSPTG
jgi:cysteine desulfuration protein SufE